MSAKKNPGRQIRAQTEEAVLIGLERLKSILSDPDTVTADVFKGLTLLFDRIYRPAEGDVHPAWYGDATFMPHLWAILGNRKSTADVYILPLIYPEGRNRKQLAKAVRDAMLKAYCEHTGWTPSEQKEPSPAAQETNAKEAARG